jgi:hypothetical protein
MTFGLMEPAMIVIIVVGFGSWSGGEKQETA